MRWRNRIFIFLSMFLLLPTGAAEIQKAQAAEEGFLRRGQTTVIEYDKQYDAYVDSVEKAEYAIKEYGIRQRALYENPEVKVLELEMEQKYGILSVNLGEMELETAREIEQAFAYMYQKYPVLQGTLTNFTLANVPVSRGTEFAVTQTREFMIHERFGELPFVVKYEIIVNALKFLNRENMELTYKSQIETGYWTEGTNTTSIIVHELAHQLVDVIKMKKFGLYEGELFDGFYITEQNEDAFSAFITDSLSTEQTVAKQIVEDSYDLWREQYHETADQEEFRSSISVYATAIQPDGGISYSETIAEAFADVYLHNEAAAKASKVIVEIAEKEL